MTSPCRNHPTVRNEEGCARCYETYCSVCFFDLDEGPVCPPCMMRPPAGGPKGALLYSLGGFGCAFAAAAFLGTMVLYGVMTGEELVDPWATLIGMATMLACFGGIALSFMGRDLSRGTGATLPMVGIVANLLLTLVFVLMSIIGSFM
ncbi:hypothetical protein [Myxococcus stipitatus]|uniref:hypothetical protein n=1 Tax=Myxococcus stipitatus TaxID=83455 RepID=UPI0002D8ECA6|nr:hypothetical protein [Myxococcus stipitatus]